LLYFIKCRQSRNKGAEIALQTRIVRRERDRDQQDGGHGLAWGVVGVMAQVGFTAGWVVTELWQGPRYSPIKDTISDMQASTAPHVWFPIAAFGIAAVATFAFVVFGLRPALAGAGKRARFAPWMLACAALALGNSFPLIPCQLSDPGCTPAFQLNSPGGFTDAIVSGLAFFVLVITPFPLWRRLATLPGWRRLRPVLLAATVIGPTLYVLLAISSNEASMPALGLIERVLATTCALWISALAVNLIIESRREPRERTAIEVDRK
jgi:hypothetical protein